jgi:hypothetical protein
MFVSLSTLIVVGFPAQLSSTGSTDIGFPLPSSLTAFSLPVLPKTVLGRAHIMLILNYLSESPTRQISPDAGVGTIKACE